LKKGSRPLGAGFLLVGLEDSCDLQVYSISPDGSSTCIQATALGARSKDVVEYLADTYSPEKVLDLSHAWSILRSCIDKVFSKDSDDYILEVLQGKFVCSSPYSDSGSETLSSKPASQAQRPQADGSMLWELFHHSAVREKFTSLTD